MAQEPSCTPPRPLTAEKFVNLFSTEIVSRKGRVPWVYASRKKFPGRSGPTADAVAVVALVAGPDGPRLVLTREFRAPLEAYELAVPAGLIDAGETAAEAAVREFREETGMTLKRVVHVSPPTASSAGLTDETVSLVYGEAEGPASAEYQTEFEDIEVKLASLADLRRLLANPGGDVFSSRIYPILIGYVSTGELTLPSPV